MFRRNANSNCIFRYCAIYHKCAADKGKNSRKTSVESARLMEQMLILVNLKKMCQV